MQKTNLRSGKAPPNASFLLEMSPGLLSLSSMAFIYSATTEHTHHYSTLASLAPGPGRGLQPGEAPWREHLCNSGCRRGGEQERLTPGGSCGGHSRPPRALRAWAGLSEMSGRRQGGCPLFIFLLKYS